MEQERETKYENIGLESYSFNEWMNNSFEDFPIATSSP
jgi:hypothetical protein